MVSYYNPMAMYRQQGPVGAPGQFHNSNSPTPSWYGAYHPGPQVPTPQQYLSCMQDSEGHQQIAWHHPHSVFNHDFFDYNSYLQQQPHPHAHPQHADCKSPQMPSPPMSSSEMSSPGAGAGPHAGIGTPPPHVRPGPVRSPYDWITKSAFQNQHNPGKTRTKDKYRVVYTDHQRLELEKEFHYSRYITIRRKAELAANLSLSERQVKIWFQNRRAKERKQQKKRQELTSKSLLNPNLSATMQLQQELLHHQHHQQHHHHHHHIEAPEPDSQLVRTTSTVVPPLQTQLPVSATLI